MTITPDDHTPDPDLVTPQSADPDAGRRADGSADEHEVARDHPGPNDDAGARANCSGERRGRGSGEKPAGVPDEAPDVESERPGSDAGTATPEKNEYDLVDEWGEQSFPSSDAPGHY